MPTKLPNGLLIFNATTHVLVFYDAAWGKAVLSESDGRVINAYAVITKVKDGLSLIASIRADYPDALIVGSIIAAQAYREEVFAPVPWHRGRENKAQKQMRPNRFNVFLKEESV
jgi:hypothetical protein